MVFITDYWERRANRKKAFIEYAGNNNFDSLIAENWYSQSLEKLMKIKVY